MFFASSTAFSQDIIEIQASQSMSISGKGPGQDAALNPYYPEDSIGVVQNVGGNSFSVRIQKNGEILRTIEIKPRQTKEIKLLKGQELYFDADLPAKAKVNFKEAK